MGLKRRAYRKYTLPLPLSSPAFAGGSLHHTPLGPAHGVIHIGSTCLAERGRPLLALQAASDAALSGGMGVGKGNQLHVRQVISGMSPLPAAPKAAADVNEHKPNRSNSPSKQIAQVQGMVAALAPGPLVWLAGEQRLDPEQACAALAGRCSFTLVAPATLGRGRWGQRQQRKGKRSQRGWSGFCERIRRSL